MRVIDFDRPGKGRNVRCVVNEDECVDCGICETRCPYNLPIRQMLKKVKELFGE